MIAMAAKKQQPVAMSVPTHLLTIEEYLALGETENGYTELQEGRILMSPSPTGEHMDGSGELYFQLRNQLPNDLWVTQDLDIDLELRAPGEPGYVRRPDLIIYQRETRDRQRREGGLIRASEILVVVEIISPGSGRTDRVIKHAEYADSGIPFYWIIDLAQPVSLQSCELTKGTSYRNRDKVTGKFETEVPFPFTIDLDTLVI
ncbi:MAG TPA: Uma2 family endonuclease [Actinokineospora sp.]|jgi:Uma2 family endonuclease|nr:Uma2 family endonuclease [Actinokineospora sp.]